jgi:hypothetical protein
MASALENWNSENKAACFRQFAEELLQMAKDTTARDGTHVPLVFVVTEKGEGSLQPIPPGIEQAQIVAALQAAVRQHPIYGIIRIHEGWAYYPQGKNDHTMRQIVEGEIAVSQLSPRDRREALVVLMESREGADVLWTTPMLREGDRVRLGETAVFEDGFRGKLPRVFGNP